MSRIIASSTLGAVFVVSASFGAGPPTQYYYARNERVPLEVVPEVLSAGSESGDVEAVRRAFAASADARVSQIAESHWRIELAPPSSESSARATLGNPSPTGPRQSAAAQVEKDRVRLAAEARVASYEEALSGARGRPELDWVYPVFREPRSGALLYPTPRVIVAVGADVGPERLAALLPESVRVVRPLRMVDQYLLELTSPRESDPLAIAADLVERYAWVRWAEPDFVQDWRRDLLPDDPLFPSQWHLSNDGLPSGVVGADARLPGAWDLETGDGSIVVAVLDDGVQIGHPDIPIFTNPGEVDDGMDNDGNGLVDDLHGWDFFSNDDNPDPCASATCSAGVGSHGTAVAGVAAATGNNAVGVTGACQDCKILPIRIANHATGLFTSNAVIADAIEYAGEMADVLNNSWGGGAVSAPIEDAIEDAAANGRGGLGSPVFFSTGNSASGYIRYFSLSGLSAGTWTYTWTYQKDLLVSAGFDTAWLDTVIFPDGTVEGFEPADPMETCGSLPAGWTSTGDASWQAVEDETRADSTFGGACSIRAGEIDDLESTSVSVTKTHAAGNTLVFATWPSAERVSVTGTGPLVVDNQVGLPECFDYLELTVSDGTDTFGPFFRTCGTFSNQGNPLQDGVVSFPASVDAAIAVGAADNFDTRSGYSQWQANELDVLCHSNGGNRSVTTTDLTGTNGYASTDYTTTFGGTSSASPLCAGIAALTLSSSPDLTETELRDLLQDNARKIGTIPYSGGSNAVYGFGAVDAESSLLSTTGAGTIVVTKATLTDGGSTTFTFDGDLDGAISSDQQLSANVLPGSYAVTELPTAGWILFDLQCDDSDSVENVETSSVTFEVAMGEIVTCEFTSCDTSVELAGITVTTDETFRSCGTLAAEDFVVDDGADVEFLAEVSISLRSGFRVEGSFSARIVDAI